MNAATLNQALGFLTFLTPAVLLYFYAPAFAASLSGKLIYALSVGVWVAYTHWKNAQRLVATLRYAPTGAQRQMLEKLVSGCGLDVKRINLRYAYTAGQTAMTVMNTIIVDPVAWDGLSDDPEAQKVMSIYQTSIEPQQQLHVARRIERLRQAMTADAFRFIVRHEAAHVEHSFSIKKIVAMFFTATLAALCGVHVAYALLPHAQGPLAVGGGLFVGIITDTLLGYLTNLIFKLRAEQQADLFAVEFSTPDEIRAAADFFRRHDEIIKTDAVQDTWQQRLPLELRSGHPGGKARASQLYAYAVRKEREMIP